MSRLRHTLLVDPNLRGFEYGTLRDFEHGIIRLTGASKLGLPASDVHRFAERHCKLGTRRQGLRRLLPRTSFPVDTDVLWTILMGPENFRLDLYEGWSRPGMKKVLYLFDTLPHQWPLIRTLVARTEWDLLLTSLPDAVSPLRELTGKTWRCVPQGILAERFRPVPLAERLIGFSSYGRRLESVHRLIQAFCRRKQIYYDYSVATGIRPDVANEDLYDNYAWHLCHSIFTVSYPVETTHPERAGALKPLTCRWFEAAAAATPLLGSLPSLPAYEEILGTNFHVPLDPGLGEAQAMERLEILWGARATTVARAAEIRNDCLNRWTWETRVRSILEML